MQSIIDKINIDKLKKNVSKFKVGDSVHVHTKVSEGDKDRIQVFSGIVISRKGRGINETFTVRRISHGEGAEKIFPINSPIVFKIVIDRVSVTMKARMYYIRNLIGRNANKVKES